MLLVSVQNLAEAEQAIDAGVDVVDFKDPGRGPLAATEPAIWRQAAERWCGNDQSANWEGASEFDGDGHPVTTYRQRSPFVGLSAALGEFPEGVALASEVPSSFRFAKIGPSGRRTAEALERLWERTALPPGVTLVPVSYADNRAASTVSAETVLETVIATGRKRLLIDTFSKDGRRLTDYLSPDRLRALLRRAHVADVWVALAGSITLDVRKVLLAAGCEPDCWGVRGDVCRPGNPIGRAAPLDEYRLKRWRRETTTASDAACRPVIANDAVSDTLETR